MKRRLFNLIFLSVLLGSGLASLEMPVGDLTGAAWADEDEGSDHGDHGGGEGGSGGSGGEGGEGGGAAGGRTSTADHDAGRLFGAEGIRLIYVNGTSERIVQGNYERVDGRGRVLERRSATSADRGRLGGLRDHISPAAVQAGVQSVITISASRQSVKIVDSAGWTELLQRNRYVLTDPNGNVVTKRAATAKDIARLSAALGLR